MCLYQCINGQLHLVEGDCPIKPCESIGGSCSGSGGDIVALPCPPPFGESNEKGESCSQT